MCSCLPSPRGFGGGPDCHFPKKIACLGPISVQIRRRHLLLFFVIFALSAAGLWSKAGHVFRPWRHAAVRGNLWTATLRRSDLRALQSLTLGSGWARWALEAISKRWVTKGFTPCKAFQAGWRLETVRPCTRLELHDSRAALAHRMRSGSTWIIPDWSWLELTAGFENKCDFWLSCWSRP